MTVLSRPCLPRVLLDEFSHPARARILEGALIVVRDDHQEAFGQKPVNHLIRTNSIVNLPTFLCQLVRQLPGPSGLKPEDVIVPDDAPPPAADGGLIGRAHNVQVEVGPGLNLGYIFNRHNQD